jgi:predicted amino acid racemase
MPELLVDIDAIGRNTEAVAALLRAHNLDLVAVTKGCLGEPRVAAAMLAGGAIALADTRDANLRRLRSALPGAELHRLHLPSLAGPFEPGDVSYVSSWEGAAAVAAVRDGAPESGSASEGGALASGRGAALGPRRVMIMLETGDEREGVSPDGFLALAARIADDRRLRLEGVATNYACFKGAPEGIRRSVEAVVSAAEALRASALPGERVSGGNSSLLRMLADGEDLPAGMTELRCGEALLLGQDALYYRPLPGCRQDACVLRAEVVEEYTRPTAEGSALRLVLDVGRQDLGGGAVEFDRPGLREIGRSADYMVVEVDAGHSSIPAGAAIAMIPAYETLVAAWTSPYVEVKLFGA